MSVTIDGTNGVTASGGLYAQTAFGGTYTDGTVVDYTTGLGRISVGTSDGIAFYNGGVASSEKMRLDSSGNLGIGTSSPVNGLTVAKYGTQWTGSTVNVYPVPAGNVFVQAQAVSNANNWIGITGSYGATTGSSNLLLQTNLNNTSQQAGHYIGSEATSATASVLTFGQMIGGATTGTNATKSEQMRIDSSGNLLVGTTSTTGSGKVNMAFSSGSNGFSAVSTDNTTNASFMQMYANGSFCGNITRVGTTSAVLYGSASDYRLKENIQPMVGALEKIAQLKPVSYAWKENGSESEGFIAHELQAVVPDAVSGEKDAVDVDGVPIYQTIDTSFLVATLTAAIQEQQAIIEQLKADVAELKAK